MQQYWALLKTVHGLLHPPGSLNSFGHGPLMSHVRLTPRLHPSEVGLNSIGRLNPTTREISKKSVLLNWFRAYSAMVLGGEPYSWRSRRPPHPPDSQFPLPASSKLHLVLPQMWPWVVLELTERFRVWPWSSYLPPPGKAAAQTV